ncbi:OmpA family protein [Tenacibaculum agarivorans]|uniref:OmpA family protein n=1 Tax=Tenacibaculum agarivorans TaxID=1908389 RepID=UPI00094B8511|nr:OmpA family protein [Tenacibaculum agarivorans]
MWKRKIVIGLSFLLSINLVAQKKKRDKYLDSLARKIQFQYKELIFRNESLDAMKEIVSYINKNHNHYLITSHTSSEGEHEKNKKLTDKRAVMIKKLLFRLNIDSTRISVIGFGENYPCCLTPTRAGRYLNRRVDIDVVSKEQFEKTKTKQ